MSLFGVIRDAITGITAKVSTLGYLNVEIPPFISTNNSTTTPLTAGSTFTGTADEINGYGIVYVNVYSDQASAADGLEVQQSSDGSNWDHCDEFSVAAASGKNFSINPYAKYLRVLYTNGAVDQTSFRLQTIYKNIGKSSSHNIKNAIVEDDDAELVKAVITGENPSGDFINFSSTNGGNFKVSLEELENGVSSNSNSQLNVTPFHADGSEGALISGVNYVSGKSGIDASTETLQIIQYEHHEIHSGSHYFVEDVQDLAINNVFDVQWTTPDTDEHAHFTFELNCEAETEWMIYRGATITTPGSAITPVNNDENSSNTSNATIAAISNTSVANANSDTPVAAATEIAHGIVGAGRNGGVIGRNREIILKRNTIYCMRAIANAAGYVNFYMTWYEHTSKN